MNQSLKNKIIILLSFLSYTFVFYFLSNTQGYLNNHLRQSIAQLKIISVEQNNLISELGLTEHKGTQDQIAMMQKTSESIINNIQSSNSSRSSDINYTFFLITLFAFAFVYKSNTSKAVKIGFYTYFSFLSLLFFVIPRII